MPHLAHISDIHFGKTFDVDVWNKIKAEIIGFAPRTIIASGDFVDSPDPLLLLAAKFELQDLCASCGPDTQFFVVPGNHDVLDFGNIWHPLAAWWFDRVMFNDTTQIRSRLESGLKFRLGLNRDTLKWSKYPRINRLKPRNWIWPKKCDGRLQSCDYRRGESRWPIKSIHDESVIACFNSNSSAVRAFVFATGQLGKGQITRIAADRPAVDCPCCGPKASSSPSAVNLGASATHLRIAVLHHHPLPIAVRNKSLDSQVSEAKLEPFLILKNGADLIHELQRQRFDLILHGHKHRPQFARVELRADDPEGYPLLVLAGGSTAKSDEDSYDNTLRDIETERNGRLTVRTFEQGELQDRRIYQEPLAFLKRRAFGRAIERAQISAEELYSEVVIDGVGHLRSLDHISGLRVRSKGVTLDGVVMNVALSAHDKRLDIELEEKSDERVTLCWRDSNDQPHKLTDPHLPEDGYCWVDFIEPLKSSGSKPLTFGVREAAANSIAMTRWELSERNRYRTGSVDPEYESVGFYISYPVEKLHLRLDFPDELDGITPEVRCHRHRDSPNFPLTFRPSQRQGARGDERFLLDTDLIEEEKKRLRYDSARSSWSLEVDRPIVGNIYALRWPVPNLLADQPIIDRTSAYQKLLLRLLAAGPGLPGPSVPTRQACQRLFVELAKLLMTRFRSDVIPDETQTAFLMVYDAKDLLLRPVLTYQSSGTLPKGSYEVPLGGGVAGAAFLHRRIVAWKNDPSSKSMIKPLSSGALDSRRVLALPIFHQQRNTSGNLELDLKPGAVVGVVTLGSDEFTSRISECDIENKTATEIGQEAQELAQKYVFDILSILSRK